MKRAVRAIKGVEDGDRSQGQGGGGTRRVANALTPETVMTTPAILTLAHTHTDL